MNTLQKCKRCGVEKELHETYFYIAKANTSGFKHTCIKCLKGKDRQRNKNSGLRETYRKRKIETIQGFFQVSLISMRAGCKRRFGYETNITLECLMELWEKQKGLCYWTGMKMFFGNQLGRAHPKKVSFERLDNNIGYLVGNVVLASNFANKGRGIVDEKTYKAFLDKIIK